MKNGLQQLQARRVGWVQRESEWRQRRKNESTYSSTHTWWRWAWQVGQEAYPRHQTCWRVGRGGRMYSIWRFMQSSKTINPLWVVQGLSRPAFSPCLVQTATCPSIWFLDFPATRHCLSVIPAATPLMPVPDNSLARKLALKVSAGYEKAPASLVGLM